MRTAEERAEMIRQQVISKLKWGTDAAEVEAWLRGTHGIVDSDAEQLIAYGLDARRSAICQAALIRVILSVIGLALVAGFFFVRFMNGYIFVGLYSLISTIMALSLGAYCVATLLRNALRMTTGEAPGPVD